MDIGLFVTFVGLVVAGLAGTLGVWMERDSSAPPRWAWVFSGLIVFATCVEMTHSVAQSAEEAETEEAMARVLERLSDMAATGTNPALEQFVGAELAAQARSNPRVMKRLEKRVAARGGDPMALRRKAADGRRAAAGLPARSKAGKAGAPGAGRTGAKAAGAGDGDPAARVRPEGEGKAGAKAGGPAAEGASKVGGALGELAAPGAEGKAGKSPAIPAVPGAEGKASKTLPAVPAAGKTGKGGPAVPAVPGLGGKRP